MLVLSQFYEESYALNLIGDRARGRRLPAQGARRRREGVRRRGASAWRPAAARSTPRSSAGCSAAAAASGPLDDLTPREREVLAAMAEGKSNRGIAESFVITETAVEKHVTRIFNKLGLGHTSHRAPARARRADLPAQQPLASAAPRRRARRAATSGRRAGRAARPAAGCDATRGSSWSAQARSLDAAVLRMRGGGDGGAHGTVPWFLRAGRKPIGGAFRPSRNRCCRRAPAAEPWTTSDRPRGLDDLKQNRVHVHPRRDRRGARRGRRARAGRRGRRRRR